MNQDARRRRRAQGQAKSLASRKSSTRWAGVRMHVRWDTGAAATPHGQLVFFAEFLATTGVFERWVSSCPLAYRSGNAPDKRDVLGTLMLALLAGHRRYAHITALRGDALAAQVLGMNKVVSEDALRRALERTDEAASAAWLRPSLMHSVREVLDQPWVLDIDASVKPLYGRQEGAEISYNPTKRKRPSHVLHTFLVANLLARERHLDSKQMRLDLASPSVHECGKLWEYAVYVTDVDYPLEAIAQLYRDRADAENAFDELKNQWGLGGFTTQDLKRCQTVARSCALIYNWWSWYCRAAHPTSRLEAITSRPLLLAAVGKATSHANQTTLYLTPLHGRADVLKRLIANIGAALQHVKAAAEQFKDLDRWGCLLRYIGERIAPAIGPPKPTQELAATR